MKPNRIRVLATLGVSVAFAAVLSGCSAISRVSAGLHDGKVTFAYCEKYSATEVSVDVVPSGNKRTDNVVGWAASGSSPMTEGTSVTYGVPPSGFRTITSRPPVSLKDAEFEVAFKDVAHRNTLPYLVGDFQTADLVEGKWRNWNGALVAHPCDG